MQINLSRKGMVDFDASAFSTKEERDMLYGIAKLDASMNRLVSVRGMQCLQNLTVLDVSRNKIKTLVGLPLRLRKLYASHNDIKAVEQLSPLTQLEVLDVSHNEITSLAGLPSHAPVLKVVKASHNRIASTRGLELCTGIQELLLDHNFIAKVEELAALKQLRSLQALAIGDNPVAAAPRNVAAMRLLIPRSAVVEGLPVVTAASIEAAATARHERSPERAGRARSSSADSRRSIDASRSSVDAASPPGPARAPPGALYRTLLKELDIGGKGLHLGAAKTSSGRRSATPPSRPRAATEVFGSTRAPQQQQQSSSATHSRIVRADPNASALCVPDATAQPLQSLSASLTNAGASIRDASGINNSTSALKSQRLLEARVRELEAELQAARGQLAESRREAANYKLQVEQLRETVERQGQVNAALAGHAIQTAGAKALQLKVPKVSITPSAASAASALAAQPPAMRQESTESAVVRPWAPSPRANGAGGSHTAGAASAATAVGTKPLSSTRAAAQATAVHRRRGEEPKHADPAPVPAETPALGVGPARRAAAGGSDFTPQHNTSSTSTSSRRNVSFGGSLFYSPPEYYR